MTARAKKAGRKKCNKRTTKNTKNSEDKNKIKLKQNKTMMEID